MKKINEAQSLGTAIDPKHEIEIVCMNCGFDLDESELENDTCSDCGQTLNLKQSTKIYATSVPAAEGSATL
jgi:rRNA maturation endonuclease Nob1